MIEQIKKCSGVKGRVREVARCGLISLLAVLLWSEAEATARAGRRQEQASGAPNSGQGVEKDLRLLELDKPIEREMAGGQAHHYQVALTSSQFLRVVVNQRGINVVVTLFAPDGNKIAEIDSPNGTQGPERLSVIAETSGNYRLEVRSLGKDAAASRYDVRITSLRAAVAQDKSRVAAERAFAEGERLRTQRAAEPLRKAIEKYEEALAHWQAAGEQAEQARTLHNIGFVYNRLGEIRKALDYYLQALPLRRASQDRRGEALTLNNIGQVHKSLREAQKAIDYYSQALLITRAEKDHRGEATTLDNLAEIYNLLGEKQKALEYLDQKLQLQRSIPDPRGEAATLNNIASVYNVAGEKQKALDYYNQALQLQRSHNQQAVATTLNNIGTVYSSLGEKQKALDYYNQALQLDRSNNNQRGAANTLSNIGNVYSSLGEKQRALECHEQALQIARNNNDRQRAISSLNNIGAVYKSLGEAQKALDYHRQALQLARELGNQELEANALSSIARLERDRGNLSESLAQIKAALTLIESQRAEFAGAEVRASYFARALDKYEFYIDLLMQLHQRAPAAGHDAAALGASERVRARTLLEMLAEARIDIRQGVDPRLVERERSLQQQLNASAEYQMRLLNARHTEEEAAAARKEIASLTTQYQELEAQIRAKSPRYAALTQPQPLTLKEIQQQVPDQDTLLLEYALGNERSYLWAVSPTSITSYELPKRAEVEASARRVYELLTAHHLAPGESEQLRRARIAKADAEYQTAAASLSRTLLGPVSSLLRDKRLVIVADGALQYVPFAALPKPEPIDEAVKARETKDIIPSPLIVDHEIISLPSASVLAVLRRETAGRKPVAGAVAVLADPVFDKDDDRVAAQAKAQSEAKAKSEASGSGDHHAASELQRAMQGVGAPGGGRRIPRLPFSREEAEAIVASAPAGSSMKALSFKANRATATSAEIANYRIIHFATHGLLNAEHPELSGVVLSLIDEKGNPQDGFLRLHEIYNLNLVAELVVLSACQTGLGKEIKGEGLVGLVRGFMYAGAPRVAASLWKVNDFATTQMMKHFYQAMLKEGLRPAEALRLAQITLLKQKRWQAPYYWAGFVLQGEWK
jgi:CHAT domain-containing protein/tetratricopeptide (TPR) repeat protein